MVYLLPICDGLWDGGWFIIVLTTLIKHSCGKSLANGAFVRWDFLIKMS